MSYHILHLLSPELHIRLDKERIHILNRETNQEEFVPLEDVAVIICASPDANFTAGALRRMAEMNVPLLITNQKFEPCAISLPYYRPTNTEVLRAQLIWKKEWRNQIYALLISSKIQNQAAVAKENKQLFLELHQLAKECSGNKVMPAEVSAAKKYWDWFVPLLSQGKEKGRHPQARQGINGMLDWGYAILTTAILRSLAAHGFIAAIGIHHKERADSFPLAYDLVEPLRPWMDLQLRTFIQKGGAVGDMNFWGPEASKIFTQEIFFAKQKVRFLYAIDLYVESFAKALLTDKPEFLQIPMIE